MKRWEPYVIPLALILAFLIMALLVVSVEP